MNADPASGTMLARLLTEEKDDEAAIGKLYVKVLARKATTQTVPNSCPSAVTRGTPR